MVVLALVYVLLGSSFVVNGVSTEENKYDKRAGNDQEALGYGIDGERYRTACPDYNHYAVFPQYVQTSPTFTAVQSN